MTESKIIYPVELQLSAKYGLFQPVQASVLVLPSDQIPEAAKLCKHLDCLFPAEQAVSVAEQALGFSRENFDLHPIYTVLVSTGWNKNDDILDQEETWAARHSPEDKPFNLGHDPRKTIGHITGSVGMDVDYNPIKDTAASADLPDKFHILTSAVIYKHISSRDPELTAEAAELIEGIVQGKWFVSMEALFTNFDYGLKHPNGTQQVVARQAETAFLTKHLRSYGGTGEYEGHQIGRILRNITFSGKGLTDNPANPESIIFNDTDMFDGVLATEEFVVANAKKKLCDKKVKKDTMSEELIQDLKEQNASLERKLSDATSKLEELGEQAVQAKLTAKDQVITDLGKEVETLEAEVKSLRENITDLEQSRDKAVADKIEIESKLAEAEKVLKAAEAAKKTTERVSALVDKGVDKTDAEKLVEDFSDLDDERFSKLVDIQAELVTAKKSEVKVEAEETEADAETEDEQQDETAEASEEVLDTAEANTDDVALASEDDSEEKADQKVLASIAEYIDSQWLSGKKE
jgi:hypothetical protein